MRSHAALAGAALGAALLWAALGTRAEPDLAQPGARDWSGDFRSFYLPNAEYLGARLAAGELPLWNPHQGAGGPFLATLQPGVLYPPNALHALLPADSAFFGLALLHVAWAAALAGGLAGALGAGSWGSALSGLAYAGSLQVVAATWSPPVLYTAAWAPGIFWAMDRAIARPGGRATAALGACLGLPMLAGWPYAVAISALGAGLYGLPLLVSRGLTGRRLPAGALASLAAGVALGALLAAPQLLPTAELLARSCRAVGRLVEAQALGGGLNAPYRPELLLQGLLRRGYNDAAPGWLALALSAVAMALPSRGRSRVLALLAAGGIGLLASFPYHTPVYDWLRALPLYADFRFPFRYRLLPTIALAVGAGVGLGALGERLGRRGAHLARALGLAVLALQLASASLPTLRHALPFARRWPAGSDTAAALGDRLGAELPGPARGRVYWAERADKLRPPAGFDAVHDLEPLTLARTAELLTFFETGRPLTLLTLPERGRGDAVAPPFFGKLVLPRDERRAAILDLFSAATLVAEAPPDWLERRYQRLASTAEGLSVFANPRALPRAYRVEHALPEPAALLPALRTLTAPHFAADRSVLLDQVPPALRRRSGAPAPKAEPVEILDWRPEQIRLRSQGEAPAVVVVTEAHYPGWQARIDGRPVPIRRANLGFRGVVLPPGRHEIEMRYRPASLRLGAALALVGLLACLLLARRPGSLAGPGGLGEARRG